MRRASGFFVRSGLGALLLALGAGGCGPGNGGDASVDSPLHVDASGAVCPPSYTRTWETYGETFFSTYCTRCHSTANVGASARMGAPAGLNWDVHDLVIENRELIDHAAAGGPLRVNDFMPFSGEPIPSDAERIELGEYLACGAP